MMKTIENLSQKPIASQELRLKSSFPLQGMMFGSGFQRRSFSSSGQAPGDAIASKVHSLCSVKNGASSWEAQDGKSSFPLKETISTIISECKLSIRNN